MPFASAKESQATESPMVDAASTWAGIRTLVTSLEPTIIADAEHYTVVMQSTEIICHRILDDNIVEVTRILFAIANALLNLDAAYKLYP